MTVSHLCGSAPASSSRASRCTHVQGGRKLRLNQSTQMMAEERKIVEEAYAGDIIGVFDPGIFHIGDTLCTPKRR